MGLSDGCHFTHEPFKLTGAMSEAAPPYEFDARPFSSAGDRTAAVRGEGSTVLAFSIDLWSEPLHPGHPNAGAPAETLSLLRRILDNHATLQLRCAALEAEKAHVGRSHETELRDALDRVHELEATLENLMSVVARYEDLLQESDVLLRRAETRAMEADSRVRQAEHGTAEAVEWLYRYMAVPLPPSVPTKLAAPRPPED